MARFGRPVRLPASVRAGLDLRTGERVLTGAPLAGGQWAIGTTRALIVADDSGTLARYGWDRVAQAAWSETASMLQVTWADGSRPLVLEMADRPGYLPEVVRERVEASVVLSRRIEVTGRRGVRVAVRREAPGAPLSTQVVADRGVDVTEPALAARIAADLAELAEQVGLAADGLPRLDSNQRPSD